MADWTLLAEGRPPRRYRAGQLIYLQGTHPDCFYCLAAGSVRSFISTPSGEERVLTVHRAGDLMGEASFFDGCPRVTSAMALEDCLILTVDRGQLDAALQRRPELAVPMLQYLARTVRLLSGHVGSASLPARQKIARWLLDQPPAEGAALRATHEGIGQAVGLSRVTVSRVLGELAQLRLVALGYRSVSVLDRAGLEALALDE
ncbi:MAG: Crp/Fnr family transcriptional regulator [Oscillospiraceae bacterium]|nr:Crp/Fnr family transcriptional regulator [Oscillospiraceae bacterium]MDE6839859.1 Crp/Fnr family transcriptional regulator [Oscillospiraceae bacterium]